MGTSNSETHIARPGSPTLSVGIIATSLMELELEKDWWHGAKSRGR